VALKLHGGRGVRGRRVPRSPSIPEACVSKGTTIQTLSWGSESRQQPFTTPPVGWAPEEPRILEPEVSSGLI
jgi:hypothetical protein